MVEENKNNAEIIGMWNSRIGRARKQRDKAAKDGNWERLLDAAKGDLHILQQGHRIPILPLQLLFAYIKAEIPLLYIRNPHIKVNPKNRTSIATAKVLETVINYIWHIKKLKREIKKSIRDALIIGHSWFKVGYTGRFGTIEDGNGQTIETIESEDYFAYRVPWKDITFDPDSIDPPYDCRWISHSVNLPIEDVKKNPKYKNTHLLQNNLNSNEEMDIKDMSDVEDSQVLKTRLEEVWDLKNRQVFTISEGVDDYIEDPKPAPYQMKGSPFSYLRFNSPNDEAYGTSDLGMVEPQVMELMKMRSMELDHIKRFNRQVIVPPETTEDEINNIKQGVTGAIIKGDPSKFGVIPYPPIQPDVYALEPRLKEDANNVGGQPATERGAVQKTTSRTLGELQEIAAGAKNRRAEKVDVMEDFVEDIASNQIATIKQFATMPYYVRILGKGSDELQAAVKSRPSGQVESGVTNQTGFTFTADDIEGEFDVEPVAGSSIPIDRTTKLTLLDSILEKLPKMGVIPGGPMYAAVGRMIAEEVELPEILEAIKQEAQAQIKMKQAQQAQAEEMKQLQLSQVASETQLDAEDVARKQRAVDVEEMDVLLEDDRKRKELASKPKGEK